MAKAKEVEKYGLDPLFERIVAEVASCQPTFWKRIGHELDPERFTQPIPKLVLEAIRAISFDSQPPSAPVIVAQRLTSWFADGRLDQDQVEEARELLADAIVDGPSFNADSIVGELAPILKRFMHKNALEKGYASFGKRGDLEEVEKILGRAKRLGVSEVSLGTNIKSSVMGGVVQRTTRQRFKLGIEELDAELRGGPRRGTFTLITGAPKSGKSMFVDHVIAEAISLATPSALASLELSEDDHYVRIVGNLTDTPYDDITRFPKSAKRAERRLRELEKEGVITFCTIKKFASGIATLQDIEEWLDLEEDRHKVKIEVLGIDYGQLLGSNTKASRHEQLSEISMQAAELSQRRDLWLFMPAQATTEAMNAKKIKTIENQHTADSRGLPKACDLHITINPREEGLVWNVAANRHGPQGEKVGPLGHDFERGRVAFVNRLGWLY